MAERIHYFAYGSNMSLARIRARVPGCVYKGQGVLNYHQLRFHKKGRDGSAKCDAYYTGNAGHSVHGVLFSLTLDEQRILDGYEGLGLGYERKQVKLQYKDDNACSAFIYYATAIDKNLCPYDWYKLHVISGAREAGLPTGYIDYIADIVAVSDPDSERSLTQLALYEPDLTR